MRLWSISPEYLDTKGLLGLWREALLAKKVLEGKTKGYKYHPQLYRFKNYENPLKAINSYLYFVFLEAKKRGYSFSENKIEVIEPLTSIIPVNSGQIIYEIQHLCKKLKNRSENDYKKLCLSLNTSSIEKISPHPLFYIVPGSIENWEKIID